VRWNKLKVWNVSVNKLVVIADKLDLALYNWRFVNKNCVAFRLVPKSTQQDKYVRYGQQEYTRKDGSTYRKRINASCYHAFRDFITQCFKSDATRVWSSWCAREGVKSDYPKWTSLVDFRNDLDNLAYQNIGSMMEPFQMIDACICKED
jgi:hypothetical protein